LNKINTSCKEILAGFKKLYNKKNIDGMARYGINTKNAFGISIYVLRDMAGRIGKNHLLARQLWETGAHEAMLLAVFLEEPGKVSEAQMGSWAKDLDSWDICDQACTSLFDQTQFAYKKAFEWSRRKEEFVKRAAFSLIAGLAVHDKKAGDKNFLKFFPIIKKESIDERNYVRKAVNWALRNIGKRNVSLNKAAIRLAEEIYGTDSKSARWIASDALRELTGEKVQKRLTAKIVNKLTSQQVNKVKNKNR